MTRIDIVSGFLGAGKTTLIKKLIKDVFHNTKIVLIENEFGEIGIDGGFLKDAGIEIKEMNSGCICCSLVGDFGTSLKEVIQKYEPDRILIEPSGVGKLSDVIKAVEGVNAEVNIQLNSTVAVVDASKCKMYIKNFGEFFINQIENAGTIILSRTDKLDQSKIEKCVEMIREYNKEATIITTPIEQLEGNDIVATMEGSNNLEKEMMDEVSCCGGHGHHHHDHEGHNHEHGEGCGCGGHGHHHHDHEGHNHEHGEGCGCGGHGHHHHDHEEHNHEHGEGCGCGGHGHHHNDHEEHDHEHGEGCGCGCHDHEHAHHHADEVFTSWGMETPAKYSSEDIHELLVELENEQEYGFVLRAKGMVPSEDGTWIYFDYVPGESEVRTGKPDVTGKLCVIGSQLKEDKIAKLFTK